MVLTKKKESHTAQMKAGEHRGGSKELAIVLTHKVRISSCKNKTKKRKTTKGDGGKGEKRGDGGGCEFELV